MPALARIAPVGESGDQYDVLFNPSSLKVSLTNRLQDEDATGGGGQPRQNTRVTTSKLETELVYDTTDTGQDVRDKTSVLKGLARATAGNPPAPPGVEFRWGRFKYVGVIESLNETLDFWAAEGIPLRATVQLAIQNVNGVADTNVEGVGGTAALNPVPAGGTGTTGAATQAGDSRAGRAIAAANGLESMRMARGGAVAVAAGVQLRAAAGFSLAAGTSAGAGFGIGATAGAVAAFGAGASAGFGAGAAAGFGGSAAAGFGASASASFGASASAGFAGGASAGFGAGAAGGFGAAATSGFGATASAGVSTSMGAFAGLGTSKTATASYRLDPAKLLPAPPLPVGSGARFDVTGRVMSGGASGLTADVATASIRFG